MCGEILVLTMVPAIGVPWWIGGILIVGLPVLAVVAAVLVQKWQDHVDRRRSLPDD